MTRAIAVTLVQHLVRNFGFETLHAVTDRTTANKAPALELGIRTVCLLNVLLISVTTEVRIIVEHGVPIRLFDPYHTLIIGYRLDDFQEAMAY